MWYSFGWRWKHELEGEVLPIYQEYKWKITYKSNNINTVNNFNCPQVKKTTMYIFITLEQINNSNILFYS